KTRCQTHSRPAFGYLRIRAVGSSTHPAPRRRSLWCCARAASRWRASAALTATGRTDLDRTRDIAVDSERGQEAGHLGATHLGWMPLVVKQDVAADPGDVGLFGPPTIVSDAEGLPNAIQKSRFGCWGRVRLADEACPPEWRAFFGYA